MNIQKFNDLVPFGAIISSSIAYQLQTGSFKITPITTPFKCYFTTGSAGKITVEIIKKII